MTNRFAGGIVPAAGAGRGRRGASCAPSGRRPARDYVALFGQFQFHTALERLFAFIRSINAYVEKRAPWKLGKSAEPADQALLRTVARHDGGGAAPGDRRRCGRSCPSATEKIDGRPRLHAERDLAGGARLGRRASRAPRWPRPLVLFPRPLAARARPVTILPLDPAANASPEALDGIPGRVPRRGGPDGPRRSWSASRSRSRAWTPWRCWSPSSSPASGTSTRSAPPRAGRSPGPSRSWPSRPRAPGASRQCQRFIDGDARGHDRGRRARTSPFGGPHFFAAFAFLDTVGAGEPFEAASVFVPRWQVAHRDGRTTAVANLLVERRVARRAAGGPGVEGPREVPLVRLQGPGGPGRQPGASRPWTRSAGAAATRRPSAARSTRISRGEIREDRARPREGRAGRGGRCTRSAC